MILSCSSDNRKSGYIYYAIDANPTTLDPALIVDVNSATIAAKLFNGLVRLGPDLDIIPDLAESWSVSDLGLTYTFILRKGVRFTTGREVKASDFKYSFERVVDPETGSSNDWIFEKIAGVDEFRRGESNEITGIRVIDDHKLEIKLSRAFSPFLGLLSMPAAYVIPFEEVLYHGVEFSRNPTGTGPYMLSQWQQNDLLELDRSRNYFDRKAKVKGIVYRIIPEEMTSIMEFELGNIDILTIPASAYSRYQKSPQWSPLISSIKGTNTYYVGLNCAKPPFGDRELRRAVNYAVDRSKILATLYEGRGRIANGPVPDVLRDWTAPEAYEYNPDRARKIIKDRGYEGMKLRFYVSTIRLNKDMAEVIQSYLKDVGLEVEITPLEWSAFKDAVNRGEPDMFWLSWWADYSDPENFLFPLFHSENVGPSGNRVRYENAAVDKLILQGQHAADKEQRNAFYEQAERMIVDDAPWIFFWHRTDYTIRQPWVQEYSIYPVYSMDKGLDVALKGTHS